MRGGSTIQPEPCMVREPRGPCRAPVACSSFGYCRHRNEAGGQPDETVAKVWRTEAYARRNQTHPNGEPIFSADGTMLDDKGNRSIFDDVDD